jgi:hypothetical protein
VLADPGVLERRRRKRDGDRGSGRDPLVEGRHEPAPGEHHDGQDHQAQRGNQDREQDDEHLLLRHPHSGRVLQQRRHLRRPPRVRQRSSL